MTSFWDQVQSSSVYLFGNWPNATQGVGGAFIGVVGAYLVARWTTRKEIARERERTRTDQGVAAAGELIRILADLPQRIRIVGNLEWESGAGVNYDAFSAWETRRRGVGAQVTEHGTLLPKELEVEAIATYGALGSVMYGEFDDEHRTIIVIDSGKAEDLEDATTQVESLLADLQAYRRDPTASKWTS